MREIEARNEALYGARDHDGNVTCDWRALAEDILAEVEDVLQRVNSVADDNSDEEPAENEAMIGGQQILEADHEIRRCGETFVPLDTFKFRNGFSICGKRWTKRKETYEELQDQKISKALLSTTLSEAAEVEYMRKANLFWSRFWKPRPKKEAILAVEAVSMKQNPCRFWVCVNHCPVGAGQRRETGTACQCKEHRLHNLGKRVVRSLDPEATVSLGMVGHACHNIDLGIGLRDVIDALLDPALADNEHTDFHKKVRAAVEQQNKANRGPSLDEAIRRSGFTIEPGKEVKVVIDKPNEARWNAFFKLAYDCSRAEGFLAIALLRAKGVGLNEDVEVRAAAAVLSNRGFVAEDHPNLDIDPSRAHLFRILVSPQAKESRYMMSAIYQLILHPILALTGDVKVSAKMMGVGGLVRRILRVILDTIWISTAPKEFECAIAHRSDNVEVHFRKDSMRCLNPACGNKIRRIMGTDLPETLLDEMVDAIPTLLHRMNLLAGMPGHVVPDTTRKIFAFMHGYLYDDNGSVTDRNGVVVEETKIIKLSQMQLHFRIMIKDAAFELRRDFAREISSPHSFATGAVTEQLTKGTVEGTGKHIRSPHPDALANVVVMRAMGRDVIAHFKKQLAAMQGPLANQHPLDFLPAIAFMWSRNGVRSSIAFTGMADPAEYEFSDPREVDGTWPVEPSLLKGKPISLLGDSGEHVQNLALCGPFEPVFSQQLKLTLFPVPIQKFPYVHRIVVGAATSSSSSGGIETNWRRLTHYFGSRNNVSFRILSSQFTNPNGVTMDLDTKAIEKDDLRFRVGLEIAKLPGWKTFHGAAKLLRESMHADFKHAQAGKKKKRLSGCSNLSGSYRGERWLNPTDSEKTAVLNRALRICHVNGFERDSSQVAAFRQRLGLPVAPPKRRAQQSEPERSPTPHPPEPEWPPALSPLPPPQAPQLPLPPSAPLPHTPSPPQSPLPVPSPPTPPPPPQSPLPVPSPPTPTPLPPPLSDGLDGAHKDTDNGNGMINSNEGPAAGASTDGERVGCEDDGGGDSEDSEGSEVLYADHDLDENPHSIAFVYDTFNACTPDWPKNSDNIWLFSKVVFKAFDGEKAAEVTRKPSAHLKGLLATFDPAPNAVMKFTVYQRCRFLKYILRDSYSGCVVVTVEALYDPNGDDWSKTMRIRRVMSTEHALKECCSPKDEGINLGKLSLQKFQKHFQQDQRQWIKSKEVYHESDVVEEADIRNLVGVVRFYCYRASDAPDENFFKPPFDYHSADLIYIGDPFRQTIRKVKRNK